MRFFRILDDSSVSHLRLKRRNALSIDSPVTVTIAIRFPSFLRFPFLTLIYTP